MDIKKAFSTSLVTFCLIKVIAYSISSESHGSERGPLLCNPNSSSAILNSSWIISLLRYSKGRRKRFLSTVYTAKWPFSAIGELLVSAGPVVCGNAILFRLIAASFCHFLANLMSFLVLTILLLYKLNGKLCGRKWWKALDFEVLMLSFVMGNKAKWPEYIYSQERHSSSLGDPTKDMYMGSKTMW